MRRFQEWMCVAWLAASVVAVTGQSFGQKSADSSQGAKPSTKATAKPAPPNIVLITLDTTRADRMGFLGSDRGLTPNLDALAMQSAVFTRAYSQAPLTPVSHATILTGTYPQFHQLNDFEVPLAQDLPYAPEILHAHGYGTAAFVASIVLDPAGGDATGFDRGFDTYDAGFHHNGPGEDRFQTIERRGSEVVAHAQAWLKQHPKGPFFLWVHLYDAHDPYDPPEPFKTRYASALYDGGVAYEDSVVGKLIEDLKARGFYDGSVVAVMADHGEGLGAHGEDTHGIFLYDETIHVPLLIKLPSEATAAKRVENRVELVDVMPTLLQLAGVATPPGVQGESLLDLIKAAPGDAGAEAWRDRQAYSETDYPRSSFGWSALRSLRTGKYLYIRAPRREVYDETADPKAEHNLASESTAVADALDGRLEGFRSKTANKREAPKAAVDPMAQEKLAALGYVAGNNMAKSAAEAHEIDPKDKIEISNLIDHAEVFLEDGNFQAAIPLFKQVIAKEPAMPGAYAKLGESLIGLKQFKEALPPLRKAVELNPDSPVPHFQLAEAMVGSGDFAGAIPELESAVAKAPTFMDAHIFLETAYARSNRVPETIRECKIVLKLRPDHFGSYLILGRFLELSGDLQGAIPNLKKAATLEPKAPEPHLILADVYQRLGRKAEAAREQAAAERAASDNH